MILGTEKQSQTPADRMSPATRARLQGLAKLLDSSMVLPGTKLTFGLDALLGLIPGVGDFIPMAIASYIIYEGWRAGAPRHILGMMATNLLIDFVVGSVPVIGDAFDVAYKANLRNLRLLGIEPITAHEG